MNYPLALRGISSIILVAALLRTSFADEAEFVSMFDGRTIEGWTVMPEEAQAAWSVEDGMIVGNGNKGRSYLVYEKNQEIV